MENHYCTLDINESATDDDIKKAYRRMAMKWHPDRNMNNKDAEEKFKVIKLAYETLSDPYKKKQYDYSLADKKRAQQPKQENKQNSNKSHSKQKDFDSFWNDHLGDIFGNKTAINSEVTINFWDAVFGCKTTFPIEITKNGKKEKQTIAITLPAGIQEEENFLIDAGGIKINLIIHIENNTQFTRSNLDLFTHINLPFTIAALGGTIKFPHWLGEVDVQIPPGVKPGQSILLSNLGIKKDIFIGDLYLICNITVPKKITPKQRELLTAFQETENNSDNLFDAIKNSWNSFFKTKP